MAIQNRMATEDYITTELSNYYLKSEADTLHTEVENYVDTQVAALVNSAPETLNTLGELATAFNENKTVVEALDEAITYKADREEILSYIDNKVPSVTTEDVGKFLRVQADGTWAAEFIAIAEEGSY